MNFSFEQLLQIVKALAPLIVAVLGILFKLGHDAREELAHAADSALKRLATGEIDSTRAKELILATGVVPEKKVAGVVAAVDAVNSKVTIRKKKGEPLEVFSDTLIPGVGVTVDTNGAVKIEPTTLTNKLGHKVGKWLKKTF
ncbi:MAG TPA: hypothetical protein PLK80_07120 [bacterium]|nr:MAG: hypothetical protein BWY28_03082 [bacterium ADurb.Bin236]HOY64292.1 hypothetical protein [bacterium]HPI76491.1 hypothetical protein [bacterium]HPN94753.1 hypothetical protein [bacterium]